MACSKLWKILEEQGIPDHLACLLQNLSEGQEARVRTCHGTMDWFKIRRGAQAGIKIARRNINNLRYADDITLMAESEEEPKNHWMKVKDESEKAGLKLNIHKMKIMASSPITSWHVDGETMETVRDFIFLGSKNHCR